jgi:hypothetical protein
MNIKIEGFVSLNNLLRDAVQKEYGAYVVDFSSGEVVFETPSTPGVEGGSSLMMVPFLVKDGMVEFQGAPKIVQRQVSYEDKVREAAEKSLKG